MTGSSGINQDDSDSRRAAERRRHKRFLPRECDMALTKEASAIMKVLGGGKKENLAIGVIDLSEGGARFLTRTKLAIGTRVSVTVTVKLFNDSVTAHGSVCWAGEHHVRQGHYYIAVAFAKLEPTDQRKIASIREYLNSPQYKLKTETKRRTRPNVDTSTLEYDS